MLELHEGDMEPDLEAVLEQPRGVPIPIGEAPVTVKVKRAGETEWRFERECTTLSDGLDGREARVLYEWQGGDTDQRGVYFVVFGIAWDEDDPQTVPSKSIEKFRIIPAA